MRAKRILAIFIVMVIVVVALPLVASAAPDAQTWYLHNDSRMYKGITNKPAGTVYVWNNFKYTWIANEPATVDVTFPGGTWTGQITLDTAFATGETVDVHVGSNAAGVFSSAGFQTLTGAVGVTTYDLSISASEFTVNAEDYLAVQIDNPVAGSDDLEVTTGGTSSCITSPASDPGYPVPELPTIILLATGLVGLAAYLGLRRRNRGHLKA